MHKQAILKSIYEDSFRDELTKTAIGAGLIAKGVGAVGGYMRSHSNIFSKGLQGLSNIGKTTPGSSGYLARGARYMGTRHGNIAAGFGAASLATGAIASPFKRDK